VTFYGEHKEYRHLSSGSAGFNTEVHLLRTQWTASNHSIQVTPKTYHRYSLRSIF